MATTVSDLHAIHAAAAGAVAFHEQATPRGDVWTATHCVITPSSHRVTLPAGIHVAAGLGAFSSRFDAETKSLQLAGAAITLLYVPEVTMVETRMEAGMHRSVGLYVTPGSEAFAALEAAAPSRGHGSFAAQAWPIKAALALALARPTLTSFDAAGRLFAEARALELIGVLLASQSGGPPAKSLRRDGVARAARDAIDADPSAVRSLWALSASLNVSPRVLAKAFRESFVMGLAAYLAGAKLDQARTALLGGMSIDDSASLAGYSRAHFTVAFTRRFGKPPRDYVDG